MYKKNIQCLTKTFLTLSLTDVASRVQLAGPAQAESYILNMVNLDENQNKLVVVVFFIIIIIIVLIHYRLKMVKFTL